MMNTTDIHLFHNVIVKFELLNLHLGKDMKMIKVAYTTIANKIRKKVSSDISPKIVDNALKQELMEKLN